MALNGTLGYRLGLHRSQPSASVDLPEIGARGSVSGANLRLKDIRLGTLGQRGDCMARIAEGAI